MTTDTTQSVRLVTDDDISDDQFVTNQMSCESLPTDLDQPSPVQGTLQSRLDIAPTNLEFSNAATWCLMQFVSSRDCNFLSTNV